MCRIRGGLRVGDGGYPFVSKRAVGLEPQRSGRRRSFSRLFFSDEWVRV